MRPRHSQIYFLAKSARERRRVKNKGRSTDLRRHFRHELVHTGHGFAVAGGAEIENHFLAAERLIGLDILNHLIRFTAEGQPVVACGGDARIV